MPCKNLGVVLIALSLILVTPAVSLHWEAVTRVHGEVFGEVFPAATLVVVKELLDPRGPVEVEAEAVVEE